MKSKEKSYLGKMNKNHFRVSIFGSARIKKDDRIYRQIMSLAKSLGSMGIDVVTGGGPGLMEAANLGHRIGSKGNKSHSIGLGIKLPSEQGFNGNLDKMQNFSRFTDRLDKFMLLSNVVIVSPGGIGTILEFFYTWQLIQVKHVCNMPIILLGNEWPGLIEWVERGPLRARYLKRGDMHHLFLAKNNKEALKVVDKAYREFSEGRKDFCSNHKKYKID